MITIIDSKIEKQKKLKDQHGLIKNRISLSKYSQI